MKALPLHMGNVVSGLLRFIKRRWVLLTCAVVLLACSCFDLQHVTEEVGFPPQYLRRFGLMNGHVGFGRYDSIRGRPEKRSYVAPAIHRPNFGDFEIYRIQPGVIFAVAIPLWLPLSAVLGWLVFLELRGREKRAKLAEVQPDQ
jgi:hypothetical protein